MMDTKIAVVAAHIFEKMEEAEQLLPNISYITTELFIESEN
jgi:hypothetical protein